MTETTKNKTRQRHNIFSADFDTQKDDFLLADIPVITDDNGLTITPLHHLVDDEDAIDRLLFNSGFDSNTGLVQIDENRDAFDVVEHIGRTNEMDVFDEFDPQEDNLSVQMAGHNQENLAPDNSNNEEAILPPLPKTTPAPKNPRTDTTEFMAKPASVEQTFHEFVTPETAPEANPPPADAQAPTGTVPEHLAEPDVFFTDVEMTALNPLKTELENLNVRHKKHPHPAKNNVHKATLISYAALGLAMIALILSIAIGMMVTGLKAEVSKLTSLLEVVRDDIEILSEKDR